MMRLILRIWHDLASIQSWLFDGDPHIDGHLYQDKALKKEPGEERDKYWVTSECRCGKKSKYWMTEFYYLKNKDILPELEEE